MEIGFNDAAMENFADSDVAFVELAAMSKAAEKRRRKVRGKKERIFNKCKGRCCFCGMKLQMENPEQKDYMTLDHIIAKCKGGTNRDENLQALCWTCNELKNQLDNDAFIEAAIRAGMYLYSKRLIGRFRAACRVVCIL
ncbi:MAG: HNH endonuclease [Clostridium sp.]|nr:HNH endonuclease [Clostridium sp.]